VALRLRRYGVTRVRPLEGGLRSWTGRHYPTEKLQPSLKDGDAAGTTTKNALSIDT